MSDVVESMPVETSMASFIVWLARQREHSPSQPSAPARSTLLRWQRAQRERLRFAG